MARPSRPWFKTSHGAYYIKHRGKLMRLGTTLEDAQRALESLQTRFDAPDVITIRQLAERFLGAAKRRVRPKTLRAYEMQLLPFASAAGDLPASQCRPLHVNGWLDLHESWNDNTRALTKKIIKLAFAWGEAEGYLETNPLHKLKVPGVTRRGEVTEDHLARFLAAVRTDALRDWCTIGLATGMRPGEQRKLTASQVKGDGQIIQVFGKTGKRTVYVAAEARHILHDLAKRHPLGPLLRTFTGKEWTEHQITDQFRVTSSRAGLTLTRGKITGLVPYDLRQLFASRLLAAGVDCMIVSTLLGHKSPHMLQRHYASFSPELLAQSVNRAG